MKTAVAKSKKSRKNNELKNVLHDIINTVKSFSETDKKLEELAIYCKGDQLCRTKNQ